MREENQSDKQLEEIYFKFKEMHKKLDAQYEKAVLALRVHTTKAGIPISSEALNKY